MDVRRTSLASPCALTELARSLHTTGKPVSALVACPVPRVRVTFLPWRAFDGLAVLVGCPVEAVDPAFLVLPEAVPPAEKRLCVNVFVLMVVCVSLARGCSRLLLGCRARRRGCSRCCWLTRRGGLRLLVRDARRRSVGRWVLRLVLR